MKDLKKFETTPCRRMSKPLEKYSFPEWTNEELLNPDYAIDLILFAQHMTKSNLGMFDSLYYQMQMENQKKKKRPLNNISLIETIKVLGCFFSLNVADEWNSYCRLQEQLHPLHVQKEQARNILAYQKWMNEVVLLMYHTLRKIPYVGFNHMRIPAGATKLVSRPGSSSQTFSLGEQIRLEVTFPKNDFWIRVPYVKEDKKISWGYDPKNRRASLSSLIVLVNIRNLLDLYFPAVLVVVIFDFLDDDTIKLG
jgi:hypothetical protein